jgi:hypothetical protein
MTERRLRKMFDDWIDRLGLGHWTIEVAVEKIKPATTTMRTTKSPHYDRGRVIVQPWVLTGTPPANWHKAAGVPFERVIQETIVHELLHLLLWECSSAIYLLADFAKHPAFTTALAVQEHYEENLVDRLSVALVGAWPR